MALTDNLISYWRLEEASGSRADSHGSNTLTDNNTVTQVAGVLGNAAQFTAANLEYLSIADNAALSAGDIDFTIAAWVYLDSKVANSAIVYKWGGTGDDYYLGYFSAADTFKFTGLSASTFGSPSTATWYFVVGWHDATANTDNICINDGTVNSAAQAAHVDGNAIFQIGAFAGAGEYASARIDSVGFWKRVLTSGEITTLYNGGAGLEYPWITGVEELRKFNTQSFRHNQRVSRRLPGFPSQQNTI